MNILFRICVWKKAHEHGMKKSLMQEVRSVHVYGTNQESLKKLL